MNLLSMSLSASILIIIVFFIRQLFIKKLPKITFILLWIIVLIRLFIPYYLPSKLSFYTLISKIIFESTVSSTPLNTPISLTPLPLKHTDEISIPFSIHLKSILFIIWLIGLCITTIY